LIRQRLPQKETLDKSQPRDLFQTPNYAIDLLVPFIPHTCEIWECAAGELKISNRLKYHGYKVLSTDIRGFELEGVVPSNFITDPKRTDIYQKLTIIITNPPYSLKRKFFQKCIEYNIPFALLISGDYSLWTIDAVRKYGCEKIIPDHRINFITPSGKSEATGHSSYFHSYWLTRYFNLGKTETFVDLTKEMRKNI
jgi:hypothetical protein